MKKYGTHSRYYLYVQFKPGFGSSFTYNSDDSRGSERGLADLLRRVLRRSVKGRFVFAKLVDRDTGETKAYFTETEMYTPESWAQCRRSAVHRQACLKGSMAFSKEGTARREKYGLPPLLTLYAGTRLEEYGDGMSCALIQLRRQAMQLKDNLPFRVVFLYRHPGNKLVGRLHPNGEVELNDETFYRELLAERLLPEAVLRIRLKENYELL